MKRIGRYLPFLFLLLLCFQLANAQSQFNLNIGFGAMHDKANSTQVDQALQNCVTNDPYPPCISTSSLSGFTMGVGGDLMLKKHYGVGMEVAFEPGKTTYANLNASAGSVGLSTYNISSRMTLYDFNGVLQPYSSKKAQIKLQAGFGGANLKFYESGSSNTVLGNQNISQYLQSTNHFQVHGAVGVDIFLTDNIFVRPEFDIHYVPNLSQFGSNAILQGMVWLGYSWGDR